jgi:DNA-binding response OmpR family regulator
MAGKRRVLLAEDNSELQAIVARFAREYECEVRSVTFGAEVLPLALEWQPELIILDISLPDIDGRDVLARLKGDARTNSVPVLVWSGRAEGESDRRIALELGAEDYLDKVEAQVLLAKARRILLRFPATDS